MVLINIGVIIPRDKASPQHIPKNRRCRNDDANVDEKLQAMTAHTRSLFNNVSGEIASQVKSGRTVRLLHVESPGLVLVNFGLIQPAELG